MSLLPVFCRSFCRRHRGLRQRVYLVDVCLRSYGTRTRRVRGIQGLCQRVHSFHMPNITLSLKISLIGMKSSMHSHLVLSDFTHAWSYHLSALMSAVYLLKGSRCRTSFETSSWHPLGLECIRPLSIYTGQMPSVAAQPPYQSTPKD